MADPTVRIPDPHLSQTAGRVTKHFSQWKRIGATPWHLQILRRGIPFEWEGDPPPDNRPFDSALSLQGRTSDLEACRKTLQHYISIGAVVQLEDQSDTTGVWSSFFPVPKKGTDKVRGCINLTTINPYLKYQHFKMEGTHTVAQMLRRKDYITKLDMSDFYMHLAVSRADRKYLRFIFEGLKYECAAMPFGLAPAPRIATKFLLPAIKYLRRRGVRCTSYIDDVVVLARSRQQSVQHTQLTADLLHSLGFSIHPEKVSVIPRQSLEVLGLQVNSLKMEFRVPRSKIRDLSRQVHRTIADNAAGRLSLRRFASLIGKFNAVRGAVQSAPLHIWPLLHLQKSVLARSRSWDDKLSLSSRVLEELTWWAQELKDWNGRSVIPRKTSITVTTDASHWGWGGFWKETGQRARPRDEARGFFSVRESKNSSNWRELTAVLLTLQSAAQALKGRVILVETDNNTTKAYINHMGGRSRVLSAIARKLWLTAQRHGFQVQAVHLPGRDNHRADRLSRWQRDKSDFKMSPAIFRAVDRQWGPHSIDLFANRLNNQIPRYAAWRPDPQAAFVDGLTVPLQRENPWCFPPEGIISSLLAKVIREQATITLVAPLWPSKPWWPTLTALKVGRPIILDRAPDTVRAVGLNTVSVFCHLRLAIWRISGAPSRIARYRRTRSAG